MREHLFACALFITVILLGNTVNAGGQLISTAVLSLEGSDWTIAADPDNTGRDQSWWTAPQPGAKPLRVPGILQETLPGYHGVVWYWREFIPPQNPYENGQCMLRFHAVDYLAEVWLNGEYLGAHEGGETPFTFDVSGAVLAGQVNRLAVRVLNPTDKPIDGIVLGETPHRNKAASGIRVGGSYNSGGIIAPVEFFWTPALRIDDVFVRADWKTGHVRLQTTVFNAGAAPVEGLFQFSISPALGLQNVAACIVTQEVPPGSSQFETGLIVENHRLWQLDDPYLYRMIAQASPANGSAGTGIHTHEYFTRFGFRELRVEKGYFRLNGKRIFLKSSHTGNHCPVGAILPPENAPDLLRKDLLYAKACGFNMVRFIAGMAYPYQLDLCDEIGLMVYEENMASWCLDDSPEMAKRFDTSLREIVLRDRNHPSLTIFGMMNEVGNGPVFQHAAASLELLRSLDDTRLVLLQSGRWDGQYHIGSVSNPGSMVWEYVWGVEGPEYTGTAKNGPYGGYFEGAGDAHIYPGTPQTPEIEAGIRNLGKDTKPVFLSEYGVGSLMNAIRELRFYEQHGANPEWDDFKFFQQTEEKLSAAWKQFGMEGVYAFPEEMLRTSQQLHIRQRLLGFNLIRSNPKICGYNLTGLLDHGYTGEGLWTFWREFKPGIMEALQDGWAPLRWCLFASPMHGYTGRPIKLEAVLANEDALAPGNYPVLLRVSGPDGIVWEERRQAVIPAPNAGEDGPFAVPVFEGDITIQGPTGRYTFSVTMERGGAPAGGRLSFYMTQAPHAAQPFTVTDAMLDPGIKSWLINQGITLLSFEKDQQDMRQIILVGNWNESNTDAQTRTELYRRVAQGSVAIFLNPSFFKKDGHPLGWLPLENKGSLTDFPDWLYHKECVAKKHAMFKELLPQGIMDWDYYGPIITNRFFEGQNPPDDTAAAAFAVCHSSRPDGFAAGLMLGAYAFGAGKMVLNTFNIIENIDKHPAADRLLLNIIEYAAESAGHPPAPLTADFDTILNISKD